ncbi:hypothetical protein CASFOL_035437 [Castilleja foliolosa]|uniref:Uncharacterized protein n=1 Tax=Castilleja foliolosa TaxID=1961234 RepID=A0ABD3BSV1_9LAMI
MSWGLIAIPQSCSIMSTNHRIPSSIRQHCCSFVPPNKSLFSSNLSTGLLKLPTLDLRCKSTSGDSGTGENESKDVLDAFFLGKALGEALNERLESAVGEFLSVIGRFQAEQQKQLFEFQDEVLEKARRAKEQASREAAEARGPVSTVDGVSKTTSSVSNTVTSTVVSSSGSKLTYEDPLIGLFKD